MQTVSFLTVGRNASNARVRHPATRVLQTLIATLLLAALPSWNALGDPATADQARSVVQGWLRADAKPLQAALGQQVKQVDTYSDANGAPLY